MTPFEELIYHNSDFSVKPIIGNKDIEKISEVLYKKETLPMKHVPPEDIANSFENPEVQGFVEGLIRAIMSASNASEKLNMLGYFEAMILNSNVSNDVINSEIFNILIKMLKTAKTNAFKVNSSSERI